MDAWALVIALIALVLDVVVFLTAMCWRNKDTKERARERIEDNAVVTGLATNVAGIKSTADDALTKVTQVSITSDNALAEARRIGNYKREEYIKAELAMLDQTLSRLAHKVDGAEPSDDMRPGPVAARKARESVFRIRTLLQDLTSANANFDDAEREIPEFRARLRKLQEFDPYGPDGKTRTKAA